MDLQRGVFASLSLLSKPYRAARKSPFKNHLDLNRVLRPDQILSLHRSNAVSALAELVHCKQIQRMQLALFEKSANYIITRFDAH
jgi:hypothetical protein